MLLISSLFSHAKELFSNISVRLKILLLDLLLNTQLRGKGNLWW